MNLLFTYRYRYVVNESPENLRNQISDVFNNNDFLMNITGNFISDDSFVLTQRFGLAVISNIAGPSPASIKGKISNDAEQTFLDIVVRPNYSIVIAIYLVLVILLADFLGKGFLERPKILIYSFLIFFDVILYGLILLFTTTLRKRFEKVMSLESK